MGVAGYIAVRLADRGLAILRLHWALYGCQIRERSMRCASFDKSPDHRGGQTIARRPSGLIPRDGIAEKWLFVRLRGWAA